MALTGIVYRLSRSGWLSAKLRAAHSGRALRVLMGMCMEAEKPRTLQQNKALHKYLTELAVALNSAGLDMRAVLKPGVDIPWTLEMAKEFLWRPIQKVMTDIESTSELDTRDVSAIYQVLDRHIAEKFGVSVPFPSEEGMAIEQMLREAR